MRFRLQAVPMRKLKVVLAVLSFAAVVAAIRPVNAQLRIEIRSGVETPVPMAIVPFGWEGSGAAAPFDVAGLVTRDLANSGRFAPIATSDMVSMPTQPSQINFQDWRIVDVDVLVIGRVIEEGADRYSVVFQLFDVINRGEQLLAFRLTTDGAQLRSTAHRIADMIFEELSGIPGIFSTQIAYVSEEATSPDDRRFRLVIADADGENPRVIAESSQPLMSPAWSPDGRRVAYVSFEGNQSAIYIQTLRTGTRERVSARAGINGAPVFSPDGRMLALTLSRDEGNLDIYTLDLASQVLRRVTDSGAIDTEPAWSSDGRSIFFTSDRAGSPQVYRVQAEPGARAQRVTFEGTYNTRPRVSPDGMRITLVHRNQGNDRIAVVDPASGSTIVLSQGQLDESPSFAPNGAMIIYATREAGKGVLAAVSSDGRIHQRIAALAGDVREPVWSPFSRL